MKYLLAVLLSLAISSPAFTDGQPTAKSIGPAKSKYDKAAAALRARYLSELEKVQKDYVKELTTAHGEAVKRGDHTEAQAILTTIQSVKDEMEANKSPVANTMLRKGSRWQGTHTHNGREFPASLTVTSRAKEKFEGLLQWQHEATGPVAVLVEGKINGNEITFEMKKVQNGKNVIFPVTYTGKLTAKSFKGTWRNPELSARGEFNYSHQP